MRQIVDASDPDLRRFAAKGKLIMFHGWADTGNVPEPTLDYYKEVVDATFSGNIERARASARLFMLPGMGHCGGVPCYAQWSGGALDEQQPPNAVIDLVLSTYCETNGLTVNLFVR